VGRIVGETAKRVIAAMNKDTAPDEDASTVTPPQADAASFLSQRAPEAIVCVPTFRRPDMLRLTLQSLVDQIGPTRFAVVVVDNDAIGVAGAAIAGAFFSAGLLEGLCVVEAQPGNCRACNRALGEARRRFASASYVLMIDDDEVADPGWLARMIAAARERQVDIVGGPVEPHFSDGVPEALARHPVYWPAYSRSGFVPMIYGSGNFLIRRQAFERLSHPEFDLRFNFLGGGDTDFFTRCRRAGLTFYWEETARIVEIVPRDRVQAAWVLRRGLRIGAINFAIDRALSRSALGRLRLAVKNVALVPVSAYRSLKLIAQGKPALVSAHPMVVAIGRLMAWFGIEPHQYRFEPAEPEP
jgi:glycosyltransferase involved in cell wall biosynthesis